MDSILHLAEKHYENVVEALTNNVIDTSGAASNLTLSASSSSTFLDPYNQSDTYTVEEPEDFHNSKDDIDD
jgi:hypothetical protein